jgi:hypothetical protein
MKTILASAALLTMVGAAQAQLTETGGSHISFGDYTSADINGTGAVSAGIRTALISTSGPGTLSVTFLGKEAGDTNSYTLSFANLSTQSISNGSAVGTTISGLVAAGALNFTFKDLSAGGSVKNGGSNGFTSYAVLGTGSNSNKLNTAGGAYTYVLGFNDGSTSDADYDDLVVGIKFTPAVAAVPEPGTYALLLAGLGAIGFTVRRRQNV